MNFPQPEEVDTPEAAIPALVLPRWTPDPTGEETNRIVVSEVPGFQTTTDTASSDAILDVSAEATASALENSEMVSDGGEEQAWNAADSAWRDELANRLNRYRARHKPRPPRYPSLRLAFDGPDGIARASDGQPPAGYGIASAHALALDAYHSCEPAVPGTEAYPTNASEALVGNNGSPALPQDPPAQRVAKVIEFPRVSSVGPPVLTDELAEPVPERPRILDVPDVIPPPPALGGIIIEAPQAPELEKRPGIDIPLQSARPDKRILAGLVDGMIIGIAAALAALIFAKITDLHPPKVQLIAFAAVVPVALWAAYQFLLVVYSGSTPGLRLAKLQICVFNGAPAKRNLRRCRVLASYLSAVSLGMGYAWMFLDEDGLCWHDRITHTYLAPAGTKHGPAE